MSRTVKISENAAVAASAKKAARVKRDLLWACEEILEDAKHCGLTPQFLKTKHVAIDYLAKRMELTPIQAVLMALFIDNCNDTRIQLNDIARWLDCSNTKMLRYWNDIDALVERGFVICRSDYTRNATYRVPPVVLEAFKRDEVYVQCKKTGLSISEFFNELDELFELREEKELSYEQLKQTLIDLCEGNKHLDMVQQLRRVSEEKFLGRDNVVLLLLFMHFFVNKDDERISYSDVDFLLDEKRDKARMKHDFNRNDFTLLNSGVVENQYSDGMAESGVFKLAKQTKVDLLAELNLPNLDAEGENPGNELLSDKITPKALFYNPQEETQVADLGSLLQEENFRSVCDRLSERGFRRGFACLFYGAPGTGKTETALQLARMTGRNLIRIDVSRIKSMWVGESEKNIRRVFSDYQRTVKSSKRAPILLFNEADAILGIRQQGAQRAVEKMENSVQNIILEELEKLEGIFIATTNLTENLDSAFERRFLYKIEFSKPTVEARTKIWQSMLPEVPQEHLGKLAEEFDFSGGQIENIARHYTIDYILHGEREDTLGQLQQFCRNERLKKGSGRKIGF